VGKMMSAAEGAPNIGVFRSRDFPFSFDFFGRATEMRSGGSLRTMENFLLQTKVSSRAFTARCCSK
jgi:hypothetical protein